MLVLRSATAHLFHVGDSRIYRLAGESLEPLRDRSRFSQFYLDYGLSSIAWLSGQDFAPEFLYEKLKAMN